MVSPDSDDEEDHNENGAFQSTFSRLVAQAKEARTELSRPGDAALPPPLASRAQNV